jgi:hypothetical protein
MDAMDTQTTEAAEGKAQAEETTSGADEQAQEQVQDNLSDEQKLAAEALAATEAPAGDTPEIEALKREDERLLGSITAKRRLNRELDRKLAEKMEAEKAAAPPEKSPEEKYLEENEDAFDPNNEPFPAKVQMAQRRWEREQAAKAQKQQEENTVTSRANASYNKAREKFSDFDTVLEDAQDLLTEGDRLDFSNAAKKGDDVAELIYKRCIYKTLEAGGDGARRLRARLQQKVKSRASVPKPNTNPTDGSQGGKETPAAQPSASAEEIAENPQLAQVYAAFGVD